MRVDMYKEDKSLCSYALSDSTGFLFHNDGERRQATTLGHVSSRKYARKSGLLQRLILTAFCAALLSGPATAQQDDAGSGASPLLATRIEADEQTGTIRIIVDGEQRALFDADGLHLDGNITYAGTLTDISDLRLKTDVRPLSGQSESIGALRPVMFGMADDPAHRTEYGLIAQEVEAVYPALVEERAGAKAVNYTGLIAPLVTAVQELQVDNVRLRARIEALEAATSQLSPETEAP